MTRVLVVDDDTRNLYLLESLLKGNGFAVEPARHGAEALAKARLGPPDLVISDLLMPVLDGYSLLRQWKLDEQLRRVPFIVYTATYTGPKDERLAMALGADAFIIKPAEPETLLQQIRDVLARDTLEEPISTFARPGEEVVLLNEYNEVLVRKLEKKAQLLEEANRELTRKVAELNRATTTLRESEERYRRLFHAITDSLFVFDRETLAFLAVNDAAVAKYGFGRDEFLNMTFKEIPPPEDVPAFLETLARLDGAAGNRGSWRHRKRDGSTIDVEITAHALEFDGRPAYLVEARDVTEQRRAQEEIAHTHDLLRAFVDGTPDSVFIKDREGKYLLCNRAAAREIGKSVDEVLGKDDAEIHGAEDARWIRGNDQLVMGSNQPQSLEEQLRTAAGPRIFQALKAPYRDASGNVIGVIGISRDVTDQKKAEMTLRLRDRAIQAVSQGIVITDSNQPDNPIIYTSAGFERITGYRSEEVLGRNCRFLQGRQTDPETVAKLRAAIAEGRSCSVEILNYRKDGNPFWNALSLNPVFDESRSLAYFVGVQNDITDRRRLEDQLRQAQKMEAVGRLAGGVAHDFNNLLTVISGYSEILLAMPDVDEAIRESVKAISEAGERAASLTRQLLGFSRKSILQPKVLDLNALITETSKMLRRLIGEDVLFTTVLAPGLRPVKVDPSQLDHALINLAVNARDAMPKGGKLTIETKSVVFDDEYSSNHLGCRPGPHVLLAVSDTGCGMTPDILARIFEPFFTTKEVGKGTGLGLAMVFGFVQQSGGCIHVYSEPGSGSIFKIYLPVVDEAILPDRGGQTRREVGGSETILLVEDEEVVRGLAILSLQMHGYKVIVADDGKDALKLLNDHHDHLHLLLTDIVMPNIGGPELAERVREKYPSIKVLFMSGYTDDAVVRHGLLDQEVSFLQKPYSPLDLARKVRQVLDGKSSGT
ncbi:MAG: PAS domain S-box protein [Planctomycetota bacterium]